MIGTSEGIVMTASEDRTFPGSPTVNEHGPAPYPAPSSDHGLPRKLVALVAALMLIAALAGYAAARGRGSGTTTVSVSAADAPSSSTALTADQIAEKVDPAIVDITTQTGSGTAAGTGMIVGSSGQILTNNHVVSGATSITVTLTSSGQSFPATLLGYDTSHDVAVLNVANVSAWPTIHAVHSSTASVGDTVFAVGNALGRGGEPAVVQGTIQGLNQTITASDESGFESETLHGLIAMAADIQPGDSGGATVDAAGDVIGMTTAGNTGVQTTSSGSTVGFAVPIDDALAVVKSIESGSASGTVHLGLHGRLGVAVQNTNDGVAVQSVEADSAAANAGLQEGDVISSVNGKTIASSDDLSDAMAATHVGDKISVSWTGSDGSMHTATTTLTVGVG